MFGQRLKELRLGIQQTQQQVADYLGITRAAYSHFENERNEPDGETIVKLAELFHVSTDYLLGRKATNFSQPSQRVQTVAAHIDDNVTDEQMEDILNYIDFIKQRHAKKD
jgi:transcriptional regulator with XRE-family HTH domain